MEKDGILKKSQGHFWGQHVHHCTLLLAFIFTIVRQIMTILTYLCKCFLNISQPSTKKLCIASKYDL